MTHTVHLSTWHPYIDGMAGTFVLEQCQAIAGAGVETGLVFSRIEGLRAIRGSRILRGTPSFVSTKTPVRSFGFKSWSLPGLRSFAPAVNRFMLKNRLSAYISSYGTPDIVHGHVALETGLAAMDFAEQSGRPFVITEHSTEVYNGLSPQRAKIASEVYSAARTVIAVSAVLAERIADIAPQANVVVIPNLVRAQVFESKRARGVSDGRVKLVSISALAAHKRIDLGLDAIARLPKELQRKIEYTIIGDGPELQILLKKSKRIEAQVAFVGNKAHGDAMSILAQGDILLHPSSYETFGVVLAEAMALGLPVIATRCGGPEGIVNAANGMLVDVDDVGSLSAALEEMLCEIDNWHSRSSGIIEYARANFHESVVADAIIKTY